ncbi:MAG: TetR/AcrR family transcriptional regulator [Rhodobacterales bacterium]
MLEKKTATNAARRPGRPRYRSGATVEDTKERLLAAGTKLFALNGYDAVSTGDIAREAGLTQSMVHYHYSSKELIWKAVIHQIMRNRKSTFPPPAEDLAKLAPVDRLKLLIQSLIRTNANNPQFVRIAVHEGTIASPRLSWLVKTYVRKGYKLFDDTIREAMEEGAIPSLPVSDMTNTITAISLLFGLQAMVDEIYGGRLNDEASLESFSNTLLHILFKGLLGAPGHTKPE